MTYCAVIASLKHKKDALAALSCKLLYIQLIMQANTFNSAVFLFFKLNNFFGIIHDCTFTEPRFVLKITFYSLLLITIFIITAN